MTTENENFAGLPVPIIAALEKQGFETLTPVQIAVHEATSAGRDLRVSSQTGSGKTVAIGLALADHFISRIEAESAAPKGPRKGGRTSDGAAHPTALVIVPTRELAAQVRQELGWLYAQLRGFQVEVVTGGTSIMLERRALSRGPNMVVGTPGRLLDHMRNGAIVCDAIEHVALDEADQMLDMGFREELEAILEQLPPKRSSHLISATFPRAVLALANRYQSDALVIEGTRLGVANADIQHVAYAIKRHETYPALVNVLLMAGKQARALLFVNRRVDASDLAEKLAADGFGAAPFSGELPQAQRTRTLNAFRNGTLPILVSTEVAARGIDVPGISMVIHVDPPRTAEAYTHRSGRTGRAGLSGRSVLFATPADMGRVNRMLKTSRIEISWQPIPTAEKVEKGLRKQARRELHAQLAEHTSEESQWMYAKQLLEDRDPVQVVAALLDMAAPEPPCKPRQVTGFDPKKERGGRPDRERARPDRKDRNDRGGRREEAGSRDAADFTRFFINWGEESGATASRILSQVCRRGGIESAQVGAIEVAARVSFVAVSKAVAGDFETRAGRPDKRDPGIIIKRAEDRPGTPKHSAPGRPARIDPGRGTSTRPSGPSAPSGSAAPAGPSGPSGPAASGRGRYSPQQREAHRAGANGAGPAPPTGPAGARTASPPTGPRGRGEGSGPAHRIRPTKPGKPKAGTKPGAWKSKKPGHKPGR